MFTGIIECMARLEHVRGEDTNQHFTFSSPITGELRVDQSLSHNGVCLTVVSIDHDRYEVTAIEETLRRTNLGNLIPGDEVNIERCMIASGRFDGHIVQGHVDCIAVCQSVTDLSGSSEFLFSHDTGLGHLTVEKGSVTVNGVSLTVVRSEPGLFSVHIIPFTMEHTNFRHLVAGRSVNVEFDIIGKYVSRLMAG